jgi:two-component system response regulator AtoC
MESNFPEVRVGAGSKRPAAGDDGFVKSVSPAMRTLEWLAADVAHTNVPVLIVGEPGTGKHAFALQIHRKSERRQESFVPLRCAELAADFFSRPGHEGNLPWASGGTLFLSEIGELGAACQPKLLRALFDGVTPVQENGAGTRIIASTRKNLELEIKAGHFREDLYYRICGVCLRVPPLRHRKEDISLLADFFLAKYAGLLQRPKPILSPQAQRFFQEHTWPGNVRELEDTIKMMIALGDERLALAGLRSRSLEAPRNHTGAERVSLKEAGRAASRQAERELILRVLSRTRWNRKRAAQELQISYKALLYKLKQIGLDDEFTSCEEPNL